jgi:hypothetical protein
MSKRTPIKFRDMENTMRKLTRKHTEKARHQMRDINRAIRALGTAYEVPVKGEFFGDKEMV